MQKCIRDYLKYAMGKRCRITLENSLRDEVGFIPAFHAISDTKNCRLSKLGMRGLLRKEISPSLIDVVFFSARKKADMKIAKSADALKHLTECI